MSHATCPKTGTGYKIKVTYAVEIAGTALTVADTRETTVDGKIESLVEIKPGGIVQEIKLMPDRVCQPLVLVIRPTKIGNVDVKKPDDLKWLNLEYATVCRDDNPGRDRKPVCGTHVFANGMAEWVTDMTKDGGPGPLTNLYFWNHSREPLYETDAAGAVVKDANGKPVPLKDEHGNAKFTPLPVTVLIFIGYSPIPNK